MTNLELLDENCNQYCGGLLTAQNTLGFVFFFSFCVSSPGTRMGKFKLETEVFFTFVRRKVETRVGEIKLKLFPYRV